MANDNVGNFPVETLGATPPVSIIGNWPKTEVQRFAEEVAASHLGMDRADLEGLLDPEQDASSRRPSNSAPENGALALCSCIGKTLRSWAFGQAIKLRSKTRLVGKCRPASGSRRESVLVS